MRSAAAIMRENKRGAIVNMSSLSGKVGLMGQTNYSAAKAGIVGMTKAAAKELAHLGVRVNAIAPGWFGTDMTQEAFANPRINKRLTRDIPARRIGRADEIGPLAVYLASSGSDFMTGQTLFLDGGHSAA